MFKRLVLVFALICSSFMLFGCSASAPDPTADMVVQAFKDTGLECEDVYDMTKDDYGLAPMVAKEGKRFLIPSLGEDNGGRIFTFNNTEDLEKTKAYYDDLGKESAAFFSWTFVKDKVLVQINGDLPEDKAKKYEAALNSIGGK